MGRGFLRPFCEDGLYNAGPDGKQIRIECKWQQISGSVDEKFPYIYLNALEAMPEEHIIILIDGGGAKPYAVAWLQKAAKNQLYKNNQNQMKIINIMNLAKFTAWANKDLL